MQLPLLYSYLSRSCLSNTETEHNIITEEMSQEEQPRRPPEPVKYGDVFEVSGELADKPIAPEDANMMQAAETRVFGHTQKGGAAAIMQSAATANKRGGFVHPGDTTDLAAERGVTVAQTEVPGARVTTEFVGGQVRTRVQT